ncbi:MAG: hypothetical protein DCC68_00540 [Planctomycetota bacterium]|nr:MAG: hypothetical protein DCC68_00540 [Planctomycetota bacterium]
MSRIARRHAVPVPKIDGGSARAESPDRAPAAFAGTRGKTTATGTAGIAVATWPKVRYRHREKPSFTLLDQRRVEQERARQSAAVVANRGPVYLT